MLHPDAFPDLRPSSFDRLVLAIIALLGGSAVFAGGVCIGFVIGRGVS